MRKLLIGLVVVVSVFTMSSCTSARHSACVGTWQGRDGEKPIKVEFMRGGRVFIDGSMHAEWRPTTNGLRFTNPHDSKPVEGELMDTGQLRLLFADGRVVNLQKGQ